MFTRLFSFGFDSDASVRERRLIFETAPTDPNDPSKIEQSPEAAGGVPKKPVNPVEALRSSAAEKVSQTAPKMILQEIKSRDDVVELLTISGALKEQEEVCAVTLGLRVRDERGYIIKDLGDATHEEREEFATLFLERLTDAELLRVIEAAESELWKAEKNMREIEITLKNAMNGVVVTYNEKNGETTKTFNKNKVVDPKNIELTLDRIYRNQDDVDNEAVTPENIVEKLGLKDISYDTEQRKDVFKAFVAMDEAKRKNKLFGVRASTPDSDEARSEARSQFSANTQQTIDTLRKYLDIRINARAGQLLKRVDEASVVYDGETLKAGISVDGVEDALESALLSLKWIRRELPGDVRPGVHDAENGLIGVREALMKLERVEDELENDREEKEPRAIVEKEVQEEECVTWAKEIAQRLLDLDLKKIAEASPMAAELIETYIKRFKPFRKGRTQTEDELIAIRQTQTKELLNIARTIVMIEENPSTFTEESLRELDERIQPDKVQKIVFGIRKKMQTVIPDVLATIKHPTAAYLNIPEAVRNLEAEILSDLSAAESMQKQAGEENSAKARKKLIDKMGAIAAAANQKMKRLERCQQMLSMIDKRDPDLIVRLPGDKYEQIAGRNSLGYYSYEDGRIYLNLSRIQSENRKESTVIDHERGHAIVDAFRRSGVFPMIMLDFHERLRDERTANGETLESLLIRQAPSWGIEIGNPNAPTDEEKWMMMDELANRYSEWKEHGKKERISKQVRSLFELCARGNQGRQPDAPIKLTRGVHLDDPAEAALAEPPDGGGPAGSPPEENKVYEESLLDGAEKKILDIDAFVLAYPEYKDDVEYYEYGAIKEAVKNGRANFKNSSYLANRTGFLHLMTAANTTLDTIQTNVVKAVDLAMSDLTHETKAGSRSIWRIITEDVNWVSTSDIMTMFKDAWEDIQRMWKRRGETARNRLGKGITEMIPDNVYLLGRLKHEFERRDRTSEEEEVGVWEKGLEKIDPHDLMHEMVPRVRSKDQLKAIINLVTKKGRMDWDDEHLWDKLEYYSGYRMPRGACRRDSDLRNQWIQKMAADIWRDKDLFEHWKAENDGAIDSGRKHLDPYVEDLSATSRLRTELRRLLYNHSRMKRGIKLAKEEEVNPHLYEGIIYYAMRAGKMSMEEKFFYLIKGVDEGLLSVDRLRTFSGENFGILNTFPFIDFFSTGQNCTKHEIRKIAWKVTEDPNLGGDPYKPGARMTKFLMEIVAFDKNVYDRVNKGLKNAEKIDHEDIPMLLTQVGFDGVHNIINFTSGSQAKVSAAGMMNGYVGYNSFMKYFGIKAKMEHPPITGRDIDKLAMTLGAYAAWDNTITRFTIGAKDDQAPRLTWQQINDQAPVSGAQKTRVYRDSMNKFTHTLATRIGIDKVNGIDIADFIGAQRNNGDSRAYLANKYVGEGKLVKSSDDLYQRIKLGYQEFVDKMSAGMTAHKDALIQTLKEMEGTLVPEADDFTFDNVSRSWDLNGNDEHAVHASVSAH